MQENVGTIDRWVRVAAGSALTVGAALAFRRNHPATSAALLIGGTLVLESAVTRVCPINAMLGIDTRSLDAETQRLPEPPHPGNKRSRKAPRRREITPKTA